MFKKDRYSILILGIILIVFNPINPLFLGGFMMIISFFVTIASLLFLLFRNEKISENKISLLLLKGLKIAGLALVLFIFLNTFLYVNYFSGSTQMLNSFAEGLPKTISAAIFHLVYLIFAVIFGGLISYAMRQRFKPNKRKTTDHLLP